MIGTVFFCQIKKGSRYTLWFDEKKPFESWDLGMKLPGSPVSTAPNELRELGFRRENTFEIFIKTILAQFMII